MRNIEDIKKDAVGLIKKSGQSSLDRRAPNPEIVFPLLQIIDELRMHVDVDPANQDAWRVLSTALEILLDYEGSSIALEKAMSLTGSRNQKDFKRLSSLKSNISEWKSIALSPQELNDLGHFLKSHILQEPFHHDFRWTRAWLALSRHSNPEVIIQALEKRGAFDDFQVWFNVTRCVK